MAGSAFDSALLSRLFSTGEVGRLFTDTAEIRAMLLVEGTLAKVQGDLGVIPELSARAIHRASMELQVDPGGLAGATGENGVCVPALVAAFRELMQAPEHAAFVHWGATSQDIIDTALMLRLRQAVTLIDGNLRRVIAALADLARTHAALPMAARTYGQHATPTSFGAVAAGWGVPLIGLCRELPALRSDCLIVSLSGAAGTASALGEKPGETRAGLAQALGLGDPGCSWHSDRTPILRLADWMTRAALALAKMGEDLSDLTMTGIGEMRLGGGGSSSTMPQKQNPVAPAALVALSRQAAGQLATLQTAASPRHQRDGAAWFTEWLCLPQIVLSAAAAAETAAALAPRLEPDADRMAANLGRDGLIHAEALSFALTERLSRPDAQAAVKALCRETVETGVPLSQLAAEKWPWLETTALFDPARQLGQAPAMARAFASSATELFQMGRDRDDGPA